MLNNGGEDWMAVRMVHVALLREELADEPVDWDEERRRRRARRMTGELVTASGAAEARGVR